MTTNYREILRLKSLGLNKTDIASAAQYSCNTMSTTLKRAQACSPRWPLSEGMPNKELAEHHAIVVVPARVRAPKDKATEEGTMGIISTYILTTLRTRQFLSLYELNEAIREGLESFNHKPFQEREGSRASAFAEEQFFLRPLPAYPYELAIWKVTSI